MKKQKGFSLIELLIVVGIIGALTAIAVPAYSNYKEKSELVSAIASLKSMRTAIDIEITENSNNFPANNSALNDLGDRGGVDITAAATTGGSLASFADSLVHATYTRNATTGAWSCKYNNKTATITVDFCEKDTGLSLSTAPTPKS
ncbi:prepilin-type N-terminal cleavage/methylation domain-containing protein [Enterovibrio sp. 27052020O]|uniref:pilin n=1 Tax=Enterovibrio sp. 27052020O TaxID=3241166 RepID=UPI00388CFE39